MLDTWTCPIDDRPMVAWSVRFDDAGSRATYRHAGGDECTGPVPELPPCPANCGCTCHA